MDIDYLSRLPVDLFIQQITYLPFDDVVNICQANSTLHNYCTNINYNNKWKALINTTFGDIDNYHEKLKQIWSNLKVNENTYNYLVYTQLVKILDPLTQLMIYYRQNDMKSFNSRKFNNDQRFLAMFLLGEKGEMDKFIDISTNPSIPSFAKLINNVEVDQNELNEMLIMMAKNGNVKWVKYLTEKGAFTIFALIVAAEKGYLDVVEYLIEKDKRYKFNAKIAFILASANGHLYVVDRLVHYVIEPHEGLIAAIENGKLDIVRYLIEYGSIWDLEDIIEAKSLATAISQGRLGDPTQSEKEEAQKISEYLNKIFP